MIVDKFISRIAGFKPNVIVHVGANSAQEMARYENCHPRRVIWIEPDATLVGQIRERIGAHSAGAVDHVCVEALITDQDGQNVVFNYFNNRGASSSIFRSTDLMQTRWPKIRETGETKIMASTRLDTALRGLSLAPEEIDVLVIDAQGAELLCLKGAGAYLEHVTFLEVEVSQEQVYEGGALASEVDTFVRQIGFGRVTRIPWHGDVVYVRESQLRTEAFQPLRPPDPERVVAATFTALRRIGSEDDAFQFLAFVLPRVPKAKSQFFQDLWALWESENKRDGYFVEFSAGNGISLSNTYLLEKEMGWSGVVAEPNPVLLRKVRENRSCYISDKCVFSQSSERIATLARAGGKSRIASATASSADESCGDPIAMPLAAETISLHNLLSEAKAPVNIDYMSVDLEGAEFEILERFDFDRWKIRLISIAHNNSPSRERLRNLLTSAGYSRKWPELSCSDDWYVRV